MTPQRALSESEIQKIISLLDNTDLAIFDIAERLGCTRRTVYEINIKYGVRTYQNGSHSVAKA